jgi:hypothetical protein
MEGSKFHPPKLPTHPHLHFVSNTVHNTLINMFISNPLITHKVSHVFFSFIYFFQVKKTSILCWKILKYLCTVDKISSHLWGKSFWKLVVLHKFNLLLFLQIMFNWSRKIIDLIQNFKVFCMGQRQNLNFV